MQQSNTADMVFSVRKIIAFLSQGTTLLPGTVILTGTPFGVGLGLKPQRWLKPGEVVTVEIEKIGKLTNPVQAPCGKRKCFRGLSAETHEGLKQARLKENNGEEAK